MLLQVKHWGRLGVVLVGALGSMAVAAAATPEPISGPARVVDGDTLTVSGVRVRLEGIDAPELAQDCERDGRSWRAGHAARRHLYRLVADRNVTCRPVGRDGYGRVIAHCSAAGHDLGADLVRAGLAWAFVRYSTTFVADERVARRARIGIWQAQCEPAWTFRSNRWTREADNAPSRCTIKGNISRNGRVYHMPWSAWYARTRIDPARGERWFCSEAEAIAAGWRPAAG